MMGSAPDAMTTVKYCAVAQASRQAIVKVPAPSPSRRTMAAASCEHTASPGVSGPVKLKVPSSDEVLE